MSSSLFYDCYAPYESYPKTVHVEGDRSFGDLQNGDVLYMLLYDCDGYRFDELKVVYKWHAARGRNYISCLRGKKNFNIDFGPTSCWNCNHESKDNSIVYYDGYIIGTDKDSIITDKLNGLAETIFQESKKLKDLTDKYDMVRNLRTHQ